MKSGDNRIKSPTREPDVRGTQHPNSSPRFASGPPAPSLELWRSVTCRGPERWVFFVERLQHVFVKFIDHLPNGPFICEQFLRTTAVPHDTYRCLNLPCHVIHQIGDFLCYAFV